MGLVPLPKEATKALESVGEMADNLTAIRELLTELVALQREANAAK